MLELNVGDPVMIKAARIEGFPVLGVIALPRHDALAASDSERKAPLVESPGHAKGGRCCDPSSVAKAHFAVGPMLDDSGLVECDSADSGLRIGNDGRIVAADFSVLGHDGRMFGRSDSFNREENHGDPKGHHGDEGEDFGEGGAFHVRTPPGSGCGFPFPTFRPGIDRIQKPRSTKRGIGKPGRG